MISGLFLVNAKGELIIYRVRGEPLVTLAWVVHTQPRPWLSAPRRTTTAVH